ncbi:glycosyl hydrolase family 18 protein [Actinokineospora sp. NBRC 105648]|uniref:chitinase n=1 Tax=Actinokineospora sp. NBRC 105648 TaxID=3032206 RepID=UPI0024A3BE5F|nr:glycosyl hydrolase family 18 protein [Actinokineospora sp. NBRC 105648]GLZ39142.1 chitinase [Actinokineospora sp. NBRC 105648]
MTSHAKRALVALLSALSVTVGLVLAFSGSAAAANLVNNPGFETGALSGWACSGGGSVTNSDKHTGSYALTAAPAGSDNARCSQTVTVNPSSKYTLTAWVKGSYVYLGATGTGTTDVSTWTPGATAWSQLSTSFTTGASTRSVTIYTHGWYGQPAYLADDISLDGPGTPPTSTSTTVTTTSTTTTKPSTTTTTTTTTPPSSTTTTTTTPPTTTTSTPPGPLPKHVLTGYWQNFDNGAKTLTIAQVPTTYDIIAVAFADATANRGEVTFTLDPALATKLGGYTDAQFKADIKTAQARGQKVIISVGGEKGTVWVGDSASSSAFANSVSKLIRDYGFDGVDIDLENGVSSQYMGAALRTIYANGGKVITFAPQTIDGQSAQQPYFQLALAVKDILTIWNMQYYNSGTMNGCDGNVYSQGTVNFLTALACIQLQGGLRADQVGLGLPASPSGAGGGYQSPANVNSALNCLAKGTGCGTFKPSTTYPGIRGAMTWSINWDASNGYAFANSVAANLDTLP